MTDTLRDIGTLAAAITAMLVLLGVLWKLPPVKWVFRHLVTDPFGQWVRNEIREEIDRTNGGSTIMDRVLEAGAQAIDNNEKLAELDDKIGDLQQQLEGHTSQDAENFGEITRKLGELATTLSEQDEAAVAVKQALEGGA